MSLRQIQLNPLNRLAVWEDIKAKREALKRAPITTSKGVFDVDDVSFQNITTAISAFAVLEDTETHTLTWKMQDNSFIAVTVADLIDAQNAVAIRANMIHGHAEVIHSEAHTIKDLEDLSLWGI